MAKQKPNVDLKDQLAEDVTSAINKKFKDYAGGAFQLLSDANLVTAWCPTGNDILDLAISNRPHGGLGYGTVVEFAGLEGSGKSLLAAHVLCECQKQGGLAVLYDTEKAVGMLDFYVSLGLNPAKVLYTDKLRALEEIYESIELIIERSIATDKDRPITIVVDSVMGASTLLELEADYEKDGYATTKAIVNSKAMRKIPSLIAGRKILIVLINQLRANMAAVGFGSDKWTTSGGVAIPFTASTRLRFSKLGQIKGKINEIETAIGERIQVQIVKNRLGPPRRKIVFDVFYDGGIDNYGSWLQCLKDTGVVSQSGKSYTYRYIDVDTGEEITHKFMSKDFPALLNSNPDLKNVIYQNICDEFIMPYSSHSGFDIDKEDLHIDSNLDD